MEENTNYIITGPDIRGYITIRPDSGYLLHKKVYSGEDRFYSIVVCKKNELLLYEAVKQ